MNLARPFRIEFLVSFGIRRSRQRAVEAPSRRGRVPTAGRRALGVRGFAWPLALRGRRARRAVPALPRGWPARSPARRRVRQARLQREKHRRGVGLSAAPSGEVASYGRPATWRTAPCPPARVPSCWAARGLESSRGRKLSSRNGTDERAAAVEPSVAFDDRPASGSALPLACATRPEDPSATGCVPGLCPTCPRGPQRRDQEAFFGTPTPPARRPLRRTPRRCGSNARWLQTRPATPSWKAPPGRSGSAKPEGLRGRGQAGGPRPARMVAQGPPARPR